MKREKHKGGNIFYEILRMDAKSEKEPKIGYLNSSSIRKIEYKTQKIKGEEKRQTSRGCGQNILEFGGNRVLEEKKETLEEIGSELKIINTKGGKRDFQNISTNISKLGRSFSFGKLEEKGKFNLLSKGEDLYFTRRQESDEPKGNLLEEGSNLLMKKEIIGRHIDLFPARKFASTDLHSEKLLSFIHTQTHKYISPLGKKYNFEEREIDEHGMIPYKG